MKRYVTVDLQEAKANNLLLTHCIVLEVIHHAQNNDIGWCYSSRKTLAEHIGISDRGLQKILAKLIDENYIEIHSKTKHIRTKEKYVNMTNCKNGVGVNKVQVRDEQSAGEGVNKVHPLPIKKGNEERREERSPLPKFERFMEVLDFLKENGAENNKKIRLEFEGIKVGISAYGKAYNLTTTNDLPRVQETRLLKYLMNNPKLLIN